MEGDPIQVRQRDDGTVLYHLPFAPSDLPPVFNRDLHAAWHAAWDGAWEGARDAAGRARPGAVRLFRFESPSPVLAPPVLALSDRDARCWAAAVDRTVGLGTAYGVSLLLRLLALVDLMTRISGPRRRGAEPPAALLRAACACRLTGDARLDETRLSHALAPTGASA